MVNLVVDCVSNRETAQKLRLQQGYRLGHLRKRT